MRSRATILICLILALDVQFFTVGAKKKKHLRSFVKNTRKSHLANRNETSVAVGLNLSLIQNTLN